MCRNPLDGLLFSFSRGLHAECKNIFMDVSHLRACGAMLSAFSALSQALPALAENGVLCLCHLWGRICSRVADILSDRQLSLGLRQYAAFRKGFYPTGLRSSLGHTGAYLRGNLCFRTKGGEKHIKICSPCHFGLK